MSAGFLRCASSSRISSSRCVSANRSASSWHFVPRRLRSWASSLLLNAPLSTAPHGDDSWRSDSRNAVAAITDTATMPAAATSSRGEGAAWSNMPRAKMPACTDSRRTALSMPNSHSAFMP